MGILTGINNSESKKIRVASRLLIDVPLLIASFLLLVIGLVFVYSSSWSYSIQAFDSSFYLTSRQLLWVFAGLLMMVILSVLPFQIIVNATPILLLLTIGGLAAILLSPAQAGVTRTVSAGSGQPSEFAKIVTVLYLAVWYATHQEEVISGSMKSLLPIAVSLVLAILVFLQPDFSATITILALATAMYILAGGKRRRLISVALIGAALSVLGYFFFDKVSVRFNEYIDGILNPAEASYHIQRVLKSIINGSWFGTGIGKGIGKMTGLPVPWTDSIYVVILEETGVFGGLIVLGLFLTIYYRGVRIAKNAPTDLMKLMAAGLTIWITFEALLNIGVLLNLFPFAGNALPLISYGGSSMIVTLASIGILLNISRESALDALKNERITPDAMVNLRGWDRGWSVSSLGRHSRNKK